MSSLLPAIGGNTAVSIGSFVGGGRVASGAGGPHTGGLRGCVAAFADRRLEGEPSLPWLYTVAERRLIGAWRRSQKTELLDPDSTPALASNETYGNRVSAALLDGLDRLPRGQREVVVLKLFHGLPFSEIASRLGISEEACRMRLSRGLATLRDRLKQKESNREPNLRSLDRRRPRLSRP